MQDFGTIDSRDGISRRRVLSALGIVGASSLAACSSSSASSSGATDAATLSDLVLSTGSLDVAFDPATTSYTVSVPNGTSELTVTPTAMDDGALITVNGNAVASGVPSEPIELSVGSNTITLVVSAPSGSPTRTYFLVVSRSSSTCVVVPTETEGPYPLASILADPALVRSDIREGDTGVPLRLVLALVNVNRGCAPIANAAVYVWHCDKDGDYSGYDNPQNGNHLGETFLRGVQVSDAAGNVSFTTIYPGWYAGRITHIHVQIFLDDDTGSPATATTQIAFPQSVTTAVYASSLYAANGQNTSVPSFAADNVFSDGVDLQLATLSGDVSAGYTAALTIGIAV